MRGVSPEAGRESMVGKICEKGTIPKVNYSEELGIRFIGLWLVALGLWLGLGQVRTRVSGPSEQRTTIQNTDGHTKYQP